MKIIISKFTTGHTLLLIRNKGHLLGEMIEYLSKAKDNFKRALDLKLSDPSSRAGWVHFVVLLAKACSFVRLGWNYQQSLGGVC